MTETAPETPSAMISISKALLGVSFAALAAFGSTSGPALATVLAIPAAALTASDSLQPLLTQLTGKKDDSLQLPVPPWWSRRNDTSWQNVCTHIERHLPAIVNATAHQIAQEQSPTQPVILRIFISEIERQLPTWDIHANERSLIASYVARPFLEKVASVLTMKINPIQMDAVIGKMDALTTRVEDIAHALTIVAAQTAVPRATTTPTTVASAPGAVSPPDLLAQKMQNNAYDVYVCYHQDDLEEVGHIDEQLKAHGILPWFDILATEPGSSLQSQQSTHMLTIQSAAVFVGKHAIEGWQAMQVEALLNELVKRKISVIPVLLPGAPQQPVLPPFLATLVWVDFNTPYPDPMMRLIWGITRIRPKM